LIAVVAGILAVSFLYGSQAAQQCVAVGEFRGCWKTYTAAVTSDLCPTSEPCQASAAAQQNNAIADVLLQACEKARGENYADAELSRQIGEIASGFKGFAIDAQTLCEQPGAVLVRQRYG
jgi:hypothetical protein